MAEGEGPEVDGGGVVAPGGGEAGRGVMLVEYENRPAAITLEKPMTELITGAKYEGRVELKPYDVLVLKED